MARRVLHLRPRGGRRRGAAGEQDAAPRAEAVEDARGERAPGAEASAGGIDVNGDVLGDAGDALPSTDAVNVLGEAPAAAAAAAIDEVVAMNRPAASAEEATSTSESRSPRPDRPRSRRGRDAGDPFSDRLRALEREIDEVLAGSGTPAEHGLASVTRAALEELLVLYADLARAFRRGGAGEVFIRLRMIGTADHVDDFGYDAAFAARVAPVLEFLYQRWWRVELSGAEHVPANGRALLVANHSGGFFPYDALMLAHGVRTRRAGGGREVRPLIEDFAYHFPGVGPLLARVGAVRASAENARRLLAAEHAVAVFPEGAKGVGKYYRERYRLQRFARGGFVTLALRTGAPLVPVAIIGAEEIHPLIAKWQWLARVLKVPYFPVTPTFPWLGLLGILPLPTKWKVIFGAPLDLAAEHGHAAADDDLLVNRLKEQVREQIQRMLVEGLRARDSVFAG